MSSAAAAPLAWRRRFGARCVSSDFPNPLSQPQLVSRVSCTLSFPAGGSFLTAPLLGSHAAQRTPHITASSRPILTGTAQCRFHACPDARPAEPRQTQAGWRCHGQDDARASMTAVKSSVCSHWNTQSLRRLAAAATPTVHAVPSSQPPPICAAATGGCKRSLSIARRSHG